jgi:hypothetical protein
LNLLARAANSFAFRSGGLYKFLLSLLPVPYRSKPGMQDMTFLSLVGRSHLDMLMYCLYSLNLSWSSLPALLIVSDGSVSTRSIHRKLARWKGLKEVRMWEDCVAVLPGSDDCPMLHRFVSQHAYGKKLLSILYAASRGATLWCDADVLWFRHPELLGSSSDVNFFIRCSEDFQPSYDRGMLVENETSLLAEPYINVGLVLIKGDLASSFAWSRIERMLALASDWGHFPEQTLLALVCKESGCNTWPLDEIACFQSDQQSHLPTFLSKKWHARHYVGPVRHLFWRDAFYLRIGLKS